MIRTDILMFQFNKKEVSLRHNAKVELGIEEDEKFKITNVIGDFELVEITNQYNQKHITNPNNLLN